VSLDECDGCEVTDGAGIISILLYSGSRVGTVLPYFESTISRREVIVWVAVGNGGPGGPGGDRERRVARAHDLSM
jgi:hypothetical protein